MGFLRFLGSVPVAIVITVGVFIMMFMLIQEPEAPVEPKEEREVVTLPEKEPPPPKETTDPETTAEKSKLPNRPRTNTPETTRPQKPDNPFRSGPTGITVTGKPGPIQTTTGVFPLIRSAPTYPASCAARGTEGSVELTFDVMGTGEVVNVEVVSSTDRCFEKAAIRAMRSWQFQPWAGREGEVIATGERQIFTFELEDD